MKLKQSPEDFQVEERTDRQPDADGPFAFYRLEKRGWSTPDALAAVRRRWQIAPSRLSYGGLKDRHAATVQYLTILHGPKRNLTHQAVTVTYLGLTAHPYTSTDIRANRFRLVLRDLKPVARPTVEARLAAVTAWGVPNYFDDQRFGSVTGSEGEFIGRLLVKGQFEAALRLALAGPYEHDRAAAREEKRLLTEHWGDWGHLKEVLPRGHARSLVDYLRVHPGDFKGAVARLRPELRGLYLSAYQSHLWNRILARWLERTWAPEQLRQVALRLGPVPFPVGSAPIEAPEALTLPLPSCRWKPAPEDPRLELVQSVLDEEGLTLRDLQVKGIRELFFSKGERAALCRAADLTHEFGNDERNQGRMCLTLAFDLPRGVYATLLVKAVSEGL
jgi:tRNA pseudouridine13 synthase